MHALQTLLAAAERGVLVTVTDDGNISARPKDKLTPELKAALRENKEEIVTGKAPGLPYEIQQIIPAEGWYVILEEDKPNSPRYRALYQVIAWALIYTHEGSYQEGEGMVWDKGEYSAILPVRELETHRVDKHLQLTPEEAEATQEGFEFEEHRLYEEWETKNRPKGNGTRDPDKPWPSTPEEWRLHDEEMRASQEWSLNGN